MSDVTFQQQLSRAFHDPLLPIERRVIGWSLGIGVSVFVGLSLAGKLLFPV